MKLLKILNKIFLALLILAILGIGFFFFYYNEINSEVISYGTQNTGGNEMYQNGNRVNTIPTTISLEDTGEQIKLEKVTNLSYTFDVGQIDSKNAVGISDSTKIEITKIAYTAKLPAKILEKTPIIFVNSLALSNQQYVLINGSKLIVSDFGPSFLYEGGVYRTYSNGQSIIFINKDLLQKMSLTETLTHEFGHAVSKELTASEWVTYRELRNIPAKTQANTWNLSPEEDFAEVYKNVFTGSKVRTFYGYIEGSDVFVQKCLTISYQRIIHNDDTESKLQECRRNALINPSEYVNKQYGYVDYHSIVGPQTKEFINSVMNRLNN